MCFVGRALHSYFISFPLQKTSVFRCLQNKGTVRREKRRRVRGGRTKKLVMKPRDRKEKTQPHPFSHCTRFSTSSSRVCTVSSLERASYLDKGGGGEGLIRPNRASPHTHSLVRPSKTQTRPFPLSCSRFHRRQRGQPRQARPLRDDAGVDDFEGGGDGLAPLVGQDAGDGGGPEAAWEGGEGGVGGVTNGGAELIW